MSSDLPEAHFALSLPVHYLVARRSGRAEKAAALDVVQNLIEPPEERFAVVESRKASEGRRRSRHGRVLCVVVLDVAPPEKRLRRFQRCVGGTCHAFPLNHALHSLHECVQRAGIAHEGAHCVSLTTTTERREHR